jgi:AAA15 family ATPase/GTPase
MRIESFYIQGFKSLADVKVEGLSDINMFYGLNDVGKSNIFQALALWNWTLTTIQSSRAGMSLSRLEATFGPSLFQLGSNKAIKLRVGITLNIDSPLGEVVNKHTAQRNPGLAIKDRVQVTSEIKIDSRTDEASFLIKNWAEIAGF